MIKKKKLPKAPKGRTGQVSSRTSRLERENAELRRENERLKRERKRSARTGTEAVRDHEKARKKQAGNDAFNDTKCPYCGGTWFNDYWHNYCGPGDYQPGTRTCCSCGCCWRLER